MLRYCAWISPSYWGRWVSTVNARANEKKKTNSGQTIIHKQICESVKSKRREEIPKYRWKDSIKTVLGNHLKERKKNVIVADEGIWLCWKSSRNMSSHVAKLTKEMNGHQSNNAAQPAQTNWSHRTCIRHAIALLQTKNNYCRIWCVSITVLQCCWCRCQWW